MESVAFRYAEDAALAPDLPGSHAETLHRRQVGHDIRHELSTIMLLASVLTGSKDVGPESRARVSQIVTEAQWLHELIRLYDEEPGEAGCGGEQPGVIRVDTLAAEVLRPIRMATPMRISLDAEEVTARADRLATWRALRNIVCNGLDAAGPDGRLAIHVSASNGFAVLDVDDDGPGFDPTQVTAASLGLKITAELIGSRGGRLRIGRGRLGGCRVRLMLPHGQPDPCAARRAGTLPAAHSL